MARVVSLVIAAVLCPTVMAGHCGQFFVAKQVAYVAPIYAAPIYYQAGADLHAEALAEKVARLVDQKLAIRQQQTQAVSQRQKASAVSQHCAKCHSGAIPKGKMVFDGQTPVLPGGITAALRAIRDGSMPKDHKLTPDQMGAVMEDLLNLEATEQPAPREAPWERPPADVPPPPTNGNELR